MHENSRVPCYALTRWSSGDCLLFMLLERVRVASLEKHVLIIVKTVVFLFRNQRAARAGSKDGKDMH